MNRYKGAIIIPTLNEAALIEGTLSALQTLRSHWLIVLSDGGSTDDTMTIARPLCDCIVKAPKGRALQLNEGALNARQVLGSSGVLVFLHADTRLPATFEQVMAEFLRTDLAWGRFDLKLSGKQSSLRLIQWMINGRSRLTGIATGDQVLFFRSPAFWQLYGFPVMPLMEDVEMSKRAKALSRPYCAKDQVITSSRKWEQEGIWKTVALMWFCRAAYFFGVSASQIQRWYYR